jgi:hypothetical protein
VDYRFFETLSREEAKEYLHGFKRAGRARISDEWWSRLTREGAPSICPYFAEVSDAVRVVQTPPPRGTPSFVVQAMERDHGGFRDFADDDSRGAVLAAAFFMGAAFIESHPSLTWAVGAEDVAAAGQPVVSGFRTGSHLPVLSVAENLLISFDEQQTTTAVTTWSKVV